MFEVPFTGEVEMNARVKKNSFIYYRTCIKKALYDLI